MPSNYARGYALENDIQRALKKLGYHTIRSSGSHGPIDILGWDSVNRYAIQCKKDSSPFSKEAFNLLADWSKDLIATPVLVQRVNRKTTWKILRRGEDWTGFKIKPFRQFQGFKPEKAVYR